MSKLPIFLLPRPFGAGVLFMLVALLAVLTAPTALGQSESGGDPSTSGGDSSGGPPPDEPTPGGTPNKVGHASIANGELGAYTYSFLSGMTSSTVIVISFRFDSLGDYTPTSVNLLLSSPSGTANRSDMSLGIFSTQPDSLDLPPALMTFSATGAIADTPDIHTFHADSLPALTAGFTYYLGVTYVGPDAVDWMSPANSYSKSLDRAVFDTFADTVAFSYRKITGGGWTEATENVGGFSITANAASAIPEPAATAAVAAGGILASALWVRWRRQRGAAEAPRGAVES